MTLRRAFVLWGGLAALALSCKTPTQITVVLKGKGIACREATGGEGPVFGGEPLFDESGVLVAPALDPSQLPAVGAKKTDLCAIGVDGTSELGEVVLLPGAGSSSVEVLAVAVVTREPPPTNPPSSVDDCVDEYERLATGEPCTVDDPCVGCIFASRSLEFIDETRLTLEIELSTACAGVFCGPGSTCVAGECVSSACAPGDPKCGVGEGGAGEGLKGQGGEGQGGGAVAADAPWTRFHELDAEGVIPWDIVGAGQGEVHTLWVAADERLCTIATGDVPLCSQAQAAGTYRAVTARNASFATAGVHGVTRSLLPITPEGYAPTTLSTFDVAIGSGQGIDWLYWGSSGAMVTGSSSVVPGDVEGGALFSLGTLTGLVFQAAGSSLYLKGRNGTFADLGTPSSQWLLWGIELGAAQPWPLFAVAADGAGDVQRVDFWAGLQELDEVRVYSPDGNAFSGPVRAVWGASSGVASVRLWAVGGGESPWLRSTEISLQDNGGASLVWAERPLPGSLSGELRSVWASETFVAIAGPGGVYEARVADLMK